jgi:GT2 family glycosyltransferase
MERRPWCARRFPSVHLVVNPDNVGVAGWNAGFARGRGELFLVLDDDCYLRGDALKRAVMATREAGADLVSFSVRSDVDASFYFNEDYHCGLLAFWGCAALISRRGVELTGGFDPNIFIWAHEAEFVARLLDGGLRHLYLPEVTAVHFKAPEQGPGSVYSIRLNTRNFAYIAGRLLRRRHALRAAANLFLRGLLIAIRRPAAAPRAAGRGRGPVVRTAAPPAGATAGLGRLPGELHRVREPGPVRARTAGDLASTR